MKFTLKGSFISIFILLVLFLSVGVISASDNSTDVLEVTDAVEISQNDDIGVNLQDNISESQLNDVYEVKNTSIVSNNPQIYYGQTAGLVSYLKDSNNQPLQNKKLTVFVNGKNYSRTTDTNGRIVLNLNLKPNTYKVNIKFNGDSNCSACNYNAIIKVLKAPVSITVNDYSTYYKSDLFFKTKVLNRVTKRPMAGIKVLFRVYYKNKLCMSYYATTDSRGVATLNRNLNVGSYRVLVSLANAERKNLIWQNSKDTAALKIKPTAEMGCCSIYLQVSSSESLTGFRRDSTYAADITIKPVVWYGRLAIKQYKTNGGYSFHSITTADGWHIATGSADSPSANLAIEKLAGSMVQSGVIQQDKLISIRKHLASIGFSIGHVAIKSPTGAYAIVWVSGYKIGKLNPGDYISVPNSRDCFRSGKYSSFDKNPLNAAVKIAATDPYGANRRDITIYHWKATTLDAFTTASVKVYAANDNGGLIGGSTGYLKDNIYFNNVFYSKNSLPMAPSKKLLGSYNFGYIHKYKIQTTVTAPFVTANAGADKVLRIVVRDKATNRLVNGIIVKVKIFTGDSFKVYSFRAVNGVVNVYTCKLAVGIHKVAIFSGNDRYFISKVSRITIKE